MVAIPAYSGQIHLGTMRSLFTDLLSLQHRGDAWSLHDECGNALIADARALIVAQFLESEADTLVFVDSDVCWEAGALLKLIDYPVDFVAGIYPQRKDPINYCVKWLEKKELWTDANGLLEVGGVPLGFAKMNRAMLEKMVAHYADLEFFCGEDKKAWALFADYRMGRVKFGEDYSFCLRWIDIGWKVYVDPEITMGHVGYKTFRGHLGNYLKGNRNGSPDAA
jgi:hypothetical protein